MNAPDKEPQQKRRYFERPDPNEKPLTLLETFVIVLSSHLGVSTKQKLQDDFRRANGLHLFIVGVVYFALVIAALIALVIHIAG